MRPMLSIDSPSNSGFPHPAAESINFGDFKLSLDGGRLENCQYFACSQTAGKSFQDAQECVRDSAAGTESAVRNGVGNLMGRILRNTKYRINNWCDAGYVRHHHDDILGLQRGIAFEKREELIM